MARTIDQWTEYSNQIAAQGREVGEATKKASKMLRNVSLGSIFNSGMFKALPQAQQDKLRSQVVDTHGYDPSGPTRSDYDSARAEAAAIRARPLSSFSSDPYSAIGGDESVEDRHAGNLERLTKLMEDRGVLDADGYTEDRADKQGVDEFMDLFQGPGEQGRDTPPDWAFEQGAVPKDYDTDPSAGYGNKYYDPGGGGGGTGVLVPSLARAGQP